MGVKKLGFGTMRLPLTDKENPASIDIEQFKKMADLFMERGFTYFDTAYPYHQEHSEEAVKEAVVKRFPRDSFILADKMPILRVTKPEDYQFFFDDQLRRCGVDYFDYYLLHNLGRDRYINTEKFGGFGFIEKLKKAGYVRNIGRDGTETHVCTLGELRDAEVDMFTTVFVGNSTSRIIAGKLITPRGYKK